MRTMMCRVIDVVMFMKAARKKNWREKKKKDKA